MATCNDCLHCEVCDALESNGISKIHPSQCGCFKNKEDVVPVVKCSQCRKRYTTECALWFSQLDDKQYFCGAIHNDDFYCSYGERKDDNG